MTGTDQLHTPDGNGKLAVLLERSEQTKAFVEQANHELHALTETTNRIERALIESTERLFARSEANSVAIKTLDDKVEHKDQSSIARDKQQVEMIHAEEEARQTADDVTNAKHDEDVAGIRRDITSIKDKLGDLIVTNRIIIFITGAIVLAIIAGVVSGKISLVVHP